MKKTSKLRWAGVLTTISMVISALVPTTVFAAAYGTPFVTSITYQNLSSSTANIVFTFYAQDSGTTVNSNKTLAGNAGSSLYLGNVVGLSAGFHGSAIMSSDQPVLATTVQVPQSGTVKNRPLSNGFSAGAPRVLIATALKNHFSATSILSVQNTDSVPADITVRFFAVGSAVALHTATVANLPAGAAHYFDLGTIPELGGDFNGSVTIESADDGGAALSGNVVAAVMELSTTGNGASAFEGVTSGATTVYMPSALCDAFGGQSSAYAVQNTSTSASTDVTVTYSNALTQQATIPAGGKQSFLACSAPGMGSGFSGSATITSVGADIVAIGKIFGTGLSTAFVGATSGAENLAMPYIRWATQADYDAGLNQRTFLAIQNIGGSTVTGDVFVRYLDKNGVEVGTHTISADIPSGGKVNSNASLAGLTQFGIYGDGTFGGSVIIDGPGGSLLVAIARVQSVVPGVETVGEDYNAIPVP
jgi:hypothetical protein